jgi:hypothetical protein
MSVTDIFPSASAAEVEHPKSAPRDRETRGPLDENEADAVRPSVDLGSLRVDPRRGMQLRLEVDKTNNRAIAVTLEYQGSTLQLQPFAAPRSSGLWHSIRGQIREQVTAQGGTATETEGPFGPELAASVPVQAEGKFGTRKVRFLGIDGPRWFLRAVIGGAAATDPDAAEAVHDMIRSVVVVRGNTPLPPRDLLPLRIPDSPENPEPESA